MPTYELGTILVSEATAGNNFGIMKLYASCKDKKKMIHVT